MSRHPFSRYWKGPVGFITGAVAAFVVFLLTHSYLLAVGTLLVASIGYAVYAMGETSDLPGTAGKNNKDVPT